MTSIDLVEPTVDRERGRELIRGWAEKNKLDPVEFSKDGLVYYPYYYGETTTTIKRVPPLPPRKIEHCWLLDAITGRPFMLSHELEGATHRVNEARQLLEPVIDYQGAIENIKGHLPRFIMRYYKYFFTPGIAARDFTLLYIKVWLYNFTDKTGHETFLGVNSWSGNIMELEDRSNT